MPYLYPPRGGCNRGGCRRGNLLGQYKTSSGNDTCDLTGTDGCGGTASQLREGEGIVRRRPQRARSGPIGFWYGAESPPPTRLVERLDAEETSVREVYALQVGRERGEWTDTINAFRERLAAVAESTTMERRSSGAALRRALLQYPRHPSLCLDLLDDLGESLTDDEALTGWLNGVASSGDLATLWRPATGSMLEQILNEPTLAARSILDEMSSSARCASSTIR